MLITNPSTAERGLRGPVATLNVSKIANFYSIDLEFSVNLTNIVFRQFPKFCESIVKIVRLLKKPTSHRGLIMD